MFAGNTMITRKEEKNHPSSSDGHKNDTTKIRQDDGTGSDQDSLDPTSYLFLWVTQKEFP